MSGIYLKCRSCQMYRPRREFGPDHDGLCRVCDPPVATKRCKACGLAKPVNEFHVDRKAATGRRDECRGCRDSTYRDTWRAKQDRRKRERFNDDPVQRLIVSTWA